MNKIIVLTFILFSFIYQSNANQTRLDFEPNQVTVYQRGAYIDFEFDMKFEKGLNKIIIDSLPFGFDPTSFIMNSDKNILINSMEYEKMSFDYENFVFPKYIKIMQDSVYDLNYDLKDMNDQIAILGQEEQIIRNYSVSSSGSAKASVQELRAHADYYAKRSRAIRKEKLVLGKKIDEINKLIKEVNKRYSTAMLPLQHDSYRLVALIKSQKSETKKLKFQCFTMFAGWQQEYDFNVKDTKTPMKLSYTAKIWQKTRYDWNDVKLVVSTRNPTIVSIYHEYTPWRIWPGYNRYNYRQEMGLNDGNSIEANVALSAGVLNAGSGFSTRGSQDKETQIRVDGLDVGNQFTGGAGVFGRGNMPYADFNLSTSNSSRARSDKSSNFQSNINISTGNQAIGTGAANYFSFEYSPDEKHTIESGKKPTMVTLNEEEVKCKYKHIFQPKITSEAFLVAELSDWGNLRLLNGSANVYLDNSYIGKSYVDVSRAKDTLMQSIGRVRGLVCERQKMREFTEEKFFGDNVRRKIGYKIKVINNKPETLEIIVQERIPISASEDISIEILEDSGASFNTETGLLEWTLELKAGESKEISYIYEADMPKGTYIE
jgi:uncharacterized protein DUF4139/uncharacterized protein DUF4140